MSKCNISNNGDSILTLGGGLFIYSPNKPSSVAHTIKDSIFQGNFINYQKFIYKYNGF